MWAVASRPDRLGSWTAEDFFASGEAQIADVVAGLRKQGLMPASTHRALDFGCGLGRLTRALSLRFDETVGVDISAGMIAQAQRLNADLSNCRFQLGERPDLSDFEDGSFDFVLSLITLQHVSSQATIRAYIGEFVRVAAPGAVILFQLPASVGWQVRLHPLRLANRALRALPSAPQWALRRLMPYSMRLMSLSEADVRRVLGDAGARVAIVFPDKATGSDAVPSLAYVATVTTGE